MAFPAYGAPDGERDPVNKCVETGHECDQRKKLGGEAKGLTDSSKHRFAEALGSFVSVNKQCKSVITMEELAQFTEVHRTVPQNSKKEIYEDADVAEGDEVLALRPKERGDATVVSEYIENLQTRKWRTTVDGGGLGGAVSHSRNRDDTSCSNGQPYDFQCYPFFSMHFWLFFQCFWCIHSQSTRIMFSLSLPKIWLSRSTSKIDALGR